MSTDKPILIVDDDEYFISFHSIVMKDAGYENIVSCNDSREVMSILATGDFEAILLDIMMPHVSGEDLLSDIKNEYPDTPVIMMTGVSSLETVVRCIKLRAFDYLLKPVEPGRILSVLKRAIEFRELRLENFSLKEGLFSEKLNNPNAFKKIVTNNRIMYKVFKYMETASVTSASILISGETGVGKEQIARVIHELSGRAGEFIAVNVAGLDDNIVADTLFGHKKGAFTSADGSRNGLIERASGGTLLLDEIGDLSSSSQVKLLRLLEEGEYYPIGSDHQKYSKARIIFSTHRDLHSMMVRGEFRRDLYYRLRTHEVEIPPLRNRLDDIPPLVDHFLEISAVTLGKKKPTPPPELVTLLSTYHFPGNIRELKSMCFDAVTLHEKGKLSLISFKNALGKGERRKGAKGTPGSPDSQELKDNQDFSIIINDRFPSAEEVVKLLISEAMKRTKGNQSIAAQMLGFSRPTLNKRLKIIEN